MKQAAKMVEEAGQPVLAMKIRRLTDEVRSSPVLATRDAARPTG